MCFITFIYKIGEYLTTYYGKYASDYISDYREGLYKEVKPFLFDGLNAYRKRNNIPEINVEVYVGILSFSTHSFIPTFSSNNKIKCFDFYYEKYDLISKTYINGKLINM